MQQDLHQICSEGRLPIILLLSLNFFWNSIKGRLDHSLESYIRNLYGAYSYGDLIAITVIALMWNIKITIVRPDADDIKIFHNSNKCDVILVHNGREDMNGRFCATGA